MKLSHKIGWINALILAVLSFSGVFFFFFQFREVLLQSVQTEMEENAAHFFFLPGQNRGQGRFVNTPMRLELVQGLYIVQVDQNGEAGEIIQDPFGLGSEVSLGTFERDGLSFLGIPFSIDSQTYWLIQEITAVVHTLSTMRNRLILFAAGLIFLSFFLGRVIAQFSLQPLLRLTRQIRGITTRNLQNRFETREKNSEIVELQQSLNQMLDKIQRGFELQKRFSSDVAHELRTPVTSIKGYAQLLEKWGLSDPQTAQESVEAIRDTAEEMRVLIEQLLQLGRLEEEQSLQKQEFASLPWRENLNLSIQRRYPSRTFVFQEKAFPASLNSNPDALAELVLIFVDNAVKFSAPDQPVEITYQARSIQVQDHGVGIAPDQLPNLFERFYRVDSSRSNRQAEGHGIGLSIAREISQKLDIDIQFQSEPGQGTQVIMRW